MKTLYVRFFRSFNYDYLRKSDLRSVPDPWDLIGDENRFYPFVRIPMERDITTVVGANESGKSQLLTAIRCLLTGEDITAEDFCRYSDLFVVDKEMSLPEFGAEFDDLSPEEAQWVRKVGKIDEDQPVSSFCFFRFESSTGVYVNGTDGWTEAKVPSREADKVKLPTVLPMHAHIPLPDSVPLAYLISADPDPEPPRSRKEHLRALGFVDRNWSKFGAATSLEEVKAEVIEAFRPATSDDDGSYMASLELAEKLLVQVAGIDRSAFRALAGSAQGTEGFAEGIVDKMNDQLADALNFPQWWTQDSQFSLTLTLRDFHLVFTVRDRTGRDYSFKERSGGMSHFLSYFVQYRSHIPAGGEEILLMDEPDAYLSSQGQQDLLRIFEAFAYPRTPDKPPVQVVYVTHSPFLIDKNHGERIRALQKGDGEEGTRVVANAAHNHYEPLRSAFGAFVAETTFIGNCNLMMEGQADQMLLAGISSLMRRLDSAGESLDLNTLSLVPAGSAEHIPYMVYLARGRDVDTPAVVVLLDGDDEADGIAEELRKGYRERRLIADSLVVQVKDIEGSTGLNISTDGLREIEDLLTADVCEAAVRRLAEQVLSSADAAVVGSALGRVEPAPGQKLFAATQAAAKAASKDATSPLRLGKVAFARAVMHVLQYEATPATRDQVFANFEVLFNRLNEAQRLANRDNESERTSGIVNRAKKNFWRNHPTSATKRDVQSLLEDMESKIPESGFEADTMRATIIKIRSDFKLTEEPMKPVEDFSGLKDRLDALAYAGQHQVLASPGAGQQTQ